MAAGVCPALTGWHGVGRRQRTQAGIGLATCRCAGKNQQSVIPGLGDRQEEPTGVKARAELERHPEPTTRSCVQVSEVPVRAGGLGILCLRFRDVGTGGE